MTATPIESTIPRVRVTALIAELQDAYVKSLATFPFKPKVRATLIDGAADGHRNGVYGTLALLGIEVVDQ